MEINKEIKEFMGKYININQYRLDSAREKCGALCEYLSNHLEGFIDTAYQGSMAYNTVIKPNPDDENGEYDVDVAVKLKYNSDYDDNPKKYYENLYDCLKLSDRYKDKVSNKKERAVRVEYDSHDGEFHVDLVPMFEKNGNWRVVDHKNNIKEISGGFLFRDWVNEQNNKTSIEGSEKKFLKKVIRIFKYFRNQLTIGEIKSVQLTLLLARQIDQLSSDSFSSISHSLYSIGKSLKDELESVESIEELDLSNPKLSEEKFDRNLDDEKFQKFKDSVISVVDIIVQAYESENEDESMNLWESIFGDGLFSNKKETNLIQYNFNHAENPLNKGYVYSKGLHEKIYIKCRYKFGNSPWTGYNTCQNSNFHGKKIMKTSCIQFYTKGVPEIYNKNYILWQVTNNSNSDTLRGEINNASKNVGYDKKLGGFVIEEYAQYTGRHRVKCYMVNESREIIAESDKFFINIQ